MGSDVNTKQDWRQGKRWSAKAKQEVVLRILRGESMEEISREEQVEMHRLQEWRDRALEGIKDSMKERVLDPETEKALKEAEAKIGRLTMELELYRGKGQRSRR